MDFKWWEADMILNYLTIGCSFVFGPLHIWPDKAWHGIGMGLALVYTTPIIIGSYNSIQALP